MLSSVRLYVKGFLYLVQKEYLNVITLPVVTYLGLSCLIFRLLQLPLYDFNPEDVVITRFLRRLFHMVICYIGYFNINSLGITGRICVRNENSDPILVRHHPHCVASFL